MIKSWVPIIRSERNILPKTIIALTNKIGENKKPKIDIDSMGVKFGSWGINLEIVKKKKMKKNNCRFFLFWNSNFADISISLSYILYILKPLF
jgi:hypothetical protein